MDMIFFVTYLTHKMPLEFVEQIIEKENFIFTLGLPNHAQTQKLLSGSGHF